MLKTVSKFLLGGLFIAAGANHFLNEAFYVRIVPPYIPQPRLVVQLSGVCECGLGALLLWPRLTRAAAWGLIALLAAIFPANVHMALHPEAFPQYKRSLLWARLPFQALFIAWAYFYTRPSQLPLKPPSFSGT